MAIKLPFPVMPLRVDYRGEDESLRSNLYAVDQMLEELYQNAQAISAGAASSTTTAVAGKQGLIGPPGQDGDPGDDGIQGPTGLTGPTGAIGPTGAQGIIGPPGDDATVDDQVWMPPGTLSNGAPSFAQGSVIFAGSSGALSQDNPHFFWDASAQRLSIGTNNSGGFTTGFTVIGLTQYGFSLAGPGLRYQVISGVFQLEGINFNNNTFNGVALSGTGNNDLLVDTSGNATTLNNLTVGKNFQTATSQNFQWVTKAANTVFTAANDGLVVGYGHGNAQLDELQILTDSSNPPTTIRFRYVSNTATNAFTGFCVPVKKGDFYKIFLGGTMTLDAGFMVPFGSTV